MAINLVDEIKRDTGRPTVETVRAARYRAALEEILKQEPKPAERWPLHEIGPALRQCLTIAKNALR
jgi:hypothetical protein